MSTEDYPPTYSLGPVRPRSHPHNSSVDIDVARIKIVCRMNSFTIEGLPEEESSLDTPIDRERPSGLFELPSFCNHSCLPTGSRFFFGDIMISRARCDLRAGEEVTLAYCDARHLPILQRQWGFTCHCALCKANALDSPRSQEIRAKSGSSELQETLEKARKRINILKMTYKNTPERRLCVVKPGLLEAYHCLGALCFKQANEQLDLTGATLEKGISALMDALEAAGMVVTDRSVFGPLPGKVIKTKQNQKSGTTRARVDNSLPVDLSKPPMYPHPYVQMILQMVAGFNAVLQKDRAERWLKVAMWCE